LPELADGEIDRAIIELEYQDVLEQRNAVSVGMATVPIGLLAILLPTMTQGWIGLLSGAILIVASLGALEMYRRRLNTELEEKRNALGQLKMKSATRAPLADAAMHPIGG
jgi:hypothetical protein